MMLLSRWSNRSRGVLWIITITNYKWGGHNLAAPFVIPIFPQLTAVHQARVKHIAQAIADQVEGKHRQHDR